MIYGSWNIKCDRQKFLSFWAIFCPFSPLPTQRVKILKLKKIPGDIIILHICTFIWCMVPEIWIATDIIFCFSGPFFALLPSYGSRKSKFWKNEKKKNPWKYYDFTKVYYKWQSYDVWFLRYGVQRTEHFVILDCFLPFYPPNPKNQNFEKIKTHLEILSFETGVT